MLDARRREVFHARYRPVPGGLQRVGDYAVGPPADLVADLEAAGDEVLLAGDGVAAHPEAFAHLERAELAGPEFVAPSVAALVELATSARGARGVRAAVGAGATVPAGERRRDRLGTRAGGCPVIVRVSVPVILQVSVTVSVP